VAEVARTLGWELMPHQRLPLDVGLEIDPETGTFAYRDVTVTEPRQGGKSTRMFSLMVWRCAVYALTCGRYQRAAYSAQTGRDARKKLLNDWVPVLETSPFAPMVTRVYQSGGDEAVAFDLSRIEVASSMTGSSHGKVLDIGVIDEAFDDGDDRREQAFMPAMATRADGQLWVCSTMGTEDGVYFNRKVEQGRLAVERGVTRGTAFFEWSARDINDAHDPARWPEIMPALNRTIAPAVVEHAQRSMSEHEFARAFGNVWTRTDTSVIPAHSWLRCIDERAMPSGGLHLALDANPDRTFAVIVAASSAGMAVEVIDRRQGLAWAVERLVDLGHHHDVRSVVLHGGGPAGTLIASLERAGLPMYVATDHEMTLAAGTFFDHIVEGTVHVRPSDVLDDAVAGARRRQRGDAFTWARRSPSTDLSPLVAASLAVWRAHNDDGGALWLFG
jgi:hypothetical protein